MKILALFSALFFLNGIYARADVKRSVDELECIKEMETSSHGQDSYKFIPSSSDITYEVVEVPGEIKSGKYVTYYTADGYTEINSQNLKCNSKQKKVDAAKTASGKMLSAFKIRETQLEALFNETMKTATDRKLIDGNSPAERAKRLELSTLQAFRKKCAAAFPQINEVLIASGALKERPALRDCLINGPHCPPRGIGPETAAPR